MVRPDSYALLEAALHARGLRLLTDAQAYARTHLLPGTLEALRPWSAPAVLLPAGRPGALRAALDGFGTRALVVKDWVKSQAGLWDEACFIPHADDAGHALAVIARFLDLQGPDLQGGVVLREWRPLVQRAGRAVEWRCFVAGGVPLPSFRRDPEPPGDALPPPPAALLHAAANAVDSPFWTMDWALQVEGGHLLLEAGDGGVSGIPEHVDPAPILRALLR